MLAFMVACSDDDDNNDKSPIKGLEIPQSTIPVKPGASVTIKGEGFTKASEIWFRQIITRATENTDIKATVTEVNATGITFTTPEVYGNQSVLLKENGKEFELGKMTFEEQPEEPEGIEILPKKITKIIFHEEEGKEEGREQGNGLNITYEYTYNKGKIKSVKVNNNTFIYTYSSDKITIKPENPGERNDKEIVIDLKDNRVSQYKSTYDEGLTDEFKYTYNGEYLSKVEGFEEEEDLTMSETFSFVQGKLISYKYDTPDYKDTQEFTYGSQLNNLNIDLFAFISDNFVSESVDETFLLGISGKRSLYLPSSLRWTTEDEEDGTFVTEVTNHEFAYKMNGNYITEMSMTDKTKQESNIRIEIFYED